MHFKEDETWSCREWADDVTGIAIDSNDRVYALQRDGIAVTVLDRSGRVLDEWTNEVLSARPHLISVGADDLIRIADDGGHRALIFDREGQLIDTIGTGKAAATITTDPGASAEAVLEGLRPGPPFNRPTKFVAGPAGDQFVSDGYRNSRIHRFTARGDLISSWGRPGSGAGEFRIPHAITADRSGRLAVCDRENDRIQFFDPQGRVLDIWNDIRRPTDVAFDDSGLAYVTELERGPLDTKSWRHGRATATLSARVSVRDTDGSMLARVTPATDEFLAPHSIAVDSHGDVYVTEVPESFCSSTGRRFSPRRCLRRFTRIH